MRNLIKCLIEDLKGDLLVTIIVVFFGVFIIYNLFINNDSSYFGKDIDGLKLEEYEEYAEEQIVEDYLRDLEYNEQEIEMNTLYYIDNGYYLHRDINCKGLDGYRNDDLNRISVEDSYDYQELSPCNWCVKVND